ncbi:MAG: SRPBCC family protein, partial [Steroidobacteraceae bacterium]
MNTSTDRIEKQILLKASRKRVWHALTDAGEFGSWFRVKLSGQFAPGKPISGPILDPGYEHLTWRVTVEKMEPERLFSWRWRPYAIDPNKDYSHEPTTLVTFELEEVPGGTLLKV